MQDYWIWWGLAVLCAVLEMATATFYLLVLAVGLAAGGLLAYLEVGFAWQLLAAAASSLCGWGLLRKFTSSRPTVAQASDHNLLLDIGSRVRVEHWSDGRHAKVQYRGASWEAELAVNEALPVQPGEFVISRLDGNKLILSRVAG